MENQDYIGWINNRAIRGHVFFTKKDFLENFASSNENTLAVALSRLIDNGLVVAPWQNFYVIVPTEYKLKRVIPPSYYIDQLMSFLGRDYYVSLLSAAGIYGAGHQRAQVFYVTANGSPLRDSVKNGTKILFSQRKDILAPQIRQVKTQTGMMNVSSPLMTALDIIYMENKIGGMSRAAEVIAELDESFKLSDKDKDLLKIYPIPVIQRFGYILQLLEYEEHAEWIYQACIDEGIRFRYAPLKAGKEVDNSCERNEKWKLIINTEIDIDEI